MSSHHTEEWIKMLPSTSHDNAEPSIMDENGTMSKKKVDYPVRTQIGIYSWRKRCLFLLIFVLILVVVLNLCLTLWFMEVLQFTSDGIGPLKVVKGGVMLSGKAYFMDTLVASTIKSRTGKPITLVTYRNLSVSVHGSDGQEMSNFFIKDDMVRFSSPSFNITGPRGETLFSANKNEIVFNTEKVRFTGQTGAVFGSSIQTPMIQGHYKEDLTIEAITRMIEIFGPSGVVLDSRAGDISVSCLVDLKIESEVGAIKLDSSKIYLPRLQTVTPAQERVTDKIKHVTVYQVCVCANGKLFLSPADRECITTDDETCR